MALDPELLKRRKRIRLPRAPPITLGAKTPLEADAKLEDLLKQLLAEAKKETLYTLTLDKWRLMSALTYANFAVRFFYNYEGQIGPGATITTYLPVPVGWVFTGAQFTYYSSLPWFLTASIWFDSDLPALPTVALLRAPDFYEYKFEEFVTMTRFQRFTVTNNHLVNTANYLGIQQWFIMTDAVWEMLEEVYLKPVIEYVQEKAEELSGRPWP